VVTVNGVQLADEESVGHDRQEVGVTVLKEQDWLVLMVNGVQLAEGQERGVTVIGTQELGVTVLTIQLVGGQELGVIVEIKDEQLPEIVEILVSVIVVGGKTTGGSVVVLVNSEQVVEAGQKLGQ
jgi:hypothetical protein